ncbi:MAG: hypothetical protein H0U59_11300 [Gemmatimonadaceae bacterium]|nr:hypothetical protein [Gemmatimonadaceae bacterium]
MKRLILPLLAIVIGCAGIPALPVSAQVDDWRILHIGLQSGASVDTDRDGVVNSWGCRSKGNSGKVNCAKSALYQQWQVDVGCFEQTVEAWTDYQINIVQESVFLNTVEVLDANPYDFAWSGWADQYGFENYDVIMVWTAYTQALGFDGGTWNGVTGGYSFIALYGVAGECPSPSNSEPWPAFVPAHEFVHAVTGLYAGAGYAVCPTYDYPYLDYGEWEGHHMILTNIFPATTCSSGIVSTGVPAEAWASGSYMDYY